MLYRAFFPEVTTMEKLAMGMTAEELARRMREFYHEHGAYRTEDVHAFLGDPTKGVCLPKRKAEDEKK